MDWKKVIKWVIRTALLSLAAILHVTRDDNKQFIHSPLEADELLGKGHIGIHEWLKIHKKGWS